MDALEDDIVSDQMDICDDDMQCEQMESDSLEVEPLAPGSGITNHQLESCLRGYPVTVCSADQLPLYVEERPNTFIVNTDTSRPGGSHWVAFHFPRKGHVEFFDSLGNSPGTYQGYFTEVLRANEPHYYYHCPFKIQRDDTDTCGLYCLYYFERRHHGIELPAIVNEFSHVDLDGNECKVAIYRELIKNNFRPPEICQSKYKRVGEEIAEENQGSIVMYKARPQIVLHLPQLLLPLPPLPLPLLTLLLLPLPLLPLLLLPLLLLPLHLPLLPLLLLPLPLPLLSLPLLLL